MGTSLSDWHDLRHNMCITRAVFMTNVSAQSDMEVSRKGLKGECCHPVGSQYNLCMESYLGPRTANNIDEKKSTTASVSIIYAWSIA